MGVIDHFDDIDPNSRLDFTIRYVDFLDGDQITGSSWTAASTNPAGGVIDEETFTTGTTTMWFISGTAGQSYRYDNPMGTLEGRRLGKSIIITVRDI